MSENGHFWRRPPYGIPPARLCEGCNLYQDGYGDYWETEDNGDGTYVHTKVEYRPCKEKTMAKLEAKVDVHVTVNQEIRPGDVVQLKSGGPMMTVEITCDDGTLIVIWFDVDGGLQRELLRKTLVKKIP